MLVSFRKTVLENKKVDAVHSFVPEIAMPRKSNIINIWAIKCCKNAQLTFFDSRMLRPNLEALSSIIHQALCLVKLIENPPSVVVFHWVQLDCDTIWMPMALPETIFFLYHMLMYVRKYWLTDDWKRVITMKQCASMMYFCSYAIIAFIRDDAK